MQFENCYYDTETGFYYLQSRYYDPAIGRFINADSFASTGQGFLGYNMFAYCGNNPVSYVDALGTASTVCFTEFTSPFVPPTSEAGGGGGLPPQNYASGNNYGSVADKFLSILLMRFVLNSDEQVVIDANYFAFFKGQLVVKQNWAISNGRSASFIFMFLHKNERDIQTVGHEWGHYIQFLQMGLFGYILNIAIPSFTSDGRNPYYYSNPWERTADFWGGVYRDEGYRYGSLAWGFLQYFLGPISVPLYYLYEQ